jgi:CRISPR-associated endonuclease/helicase Cas3
MIESLVKFQVLWADKPDDQQAERRWAAEGPKRYLAATLAVGTVDQALLGALQIKHAHLRQAMLSRNLLVVDEVHASDAYMTALLDQLLRAHVACGGHALLLSATLGATARARFLSVGATGRRAAVPALAEAQALPYPAISTRVAASPQVRAVEGNPRCKLAHWRTLDCIDEPARIAALAVQAAAQGARVLVVRNTVPAAVATLRAVEALTPTQGDDWLFRLNGISTLHHSRFSRQDRPRLDAEVQSQIGKVRVQPGGRIVIGTQTLEQSLDIDADLLITDLCPMDVLLQRLGRLHRHERPSAEHPQDHRPAGFIDAQAWVLTPLGGNLAPLLKRTRHGLGPIRRKDMDGVYVDVRSLEATRRLIDAQPTRRIPTDNRVLVEQATHGEALDAVARECGPDWQEFGMQYEGAIGARDSVARLQTLPYGEAYYPGSFPEDEHKLGSRLGAADRLVLIDPPCNGPFGRAVKELALRHHQLPHGLPPDAQAEHVQALPADGGFDFTLGDARYRYSRLGLERLREESTDAP